MQKAIQVDQYEMILLYYNTFLSQKSYNVNDAILAISEPGLWTGFIKSTLWFFIRIK